MIGKTENQGQADMFRPLLKQFINPQEGLFLLSEAINWGYFEKEFSDLYSKVGAPSMPIRFMVGCLILKQMKNLGDESLAQVWVENPYMQYFTGMAHFTHKFPCDPSDFVHFRKRIGVEGVEKIFKYSVLLHGGIKKEEKMLLSDTTVQGNNITYPTDSKMAKKIIDKCNKIAEKEGIKQRQRYTREAKSTLRKTYNGNHAKRRKEANKAKRHIKTIAGRLVRELERKLDAKGKEKYGKDLAMYKKVLAQKQNDKNKIYSLDKPFTACIAKGKEGKPYEFGNKVGIMLSPKRLIITAVDTFDGNPFDGHTIQPLLEQMENNFDTLPQEVVYDRGGRGKSNIKGVKISIPKKPKTSDTPYKKNKERKKFRRRAAIEPVFGHLKHRFRMLNNFLHGKHSPKINAFLSAAAWNFHKFMQNLVLKAKKQLFFAFYWLRSLFNILNFFIPKPHLYFLL